MAVFEASSGPPQKLLSVEAHSIDFVPHTERFGVARKTFFPWFASNVTIMSLAMGALTVSVGLSFWWALLAIAIGNALGGLLMAAHSAQGPSLGIPQMIQSRAQFGFRGAALPTVLVFIMGIFGLMFMGTLTANALAAWTGWSFALCITLSNGASALLAILGYRMVHVVSRALSWASGILFLVLTISLVNGHDFGGTVLSEHGFSWVGFLAAVTLCVTWQLTYAPYVADYSRYLPENTSKRAAFWWTFAGTTTSATWLFAVGAAAFLIAEDAFAGGDVRFVVNQIGFASGPIYLVIWAGGVLLGMMALYSAFMSFLTTATSLLDLRSLRIRPQVRAAIILLVGATSTVLAITLTGDYLSSLFNFIHGLSLVLVPWSAINLVDFYFVRKERYDIKAIFDPKGRYGGVDWRAMAALGAAMVAEVPFAHLPFWTGPVNQMLDGTDISWIAGTFVAGLVFYILMKTYPRRNGFMPTPEEEKRANATGR